MMRSGQQKNDRSNERLATIPASGHASWGGDASVIAFDGWNLEPLFQEKEIH